MLNDRTRIGVAAASLLVVALLLRTGCSFDAGPGETASRDSARATDADSLDRIRYRDRRRLAGSGATRTGDLSGRVVGPRGAPLPACIVVVVPTARDGLRNPPIEQRTSSDGTFAVGGLPSGQVTVTAESDVDGRRHVANAEVTVSAGQTTNVRLQLNPSDAILVEGHAVWDDTGEPVRKFELILWSPDERSWAAKRVRVRGGAGAFRWKLPGPGRWRAWTAVVDGQALPEFMEELSIADGEALVLRFPRPATAILRVVDGESGAPLPLARAYAARDDLPQFRAGYMLPGAATLAVPHLTADATGLINLGAWRNEAEWFIVAPAHAWKAVRLRRDDQSPQTVSLRPGGAAQIEIAQWDALLSARVSVRSAGGRELSLEQPNSRGRVRVDGLSVGRHRVTVQRGDWYERTQIYGRGEIDIIAGETTRLTIEATPVERGEVLTLTGTLHVSKDWGMWPTRLRYHGADATNRHVAGVVQLDVPLEGRTVSFRVEGLAAGRYRFVAEPIQWRAEVDADPASPHVELDAGRPAEVLVTVMTEAGEETPPGGQVLWSTRLPGLTEWSTNFATFDAARGAFLILAPQGTVHVDAHAPGYVPESREIVTTGGPTSVTIRMRQSGVMIVRLERDDRRFTDEEPMIWLSPGVDPDDRAHGARGTPARRGVARFDGLPPGQYTAWVREGDLESHDVSTATASVAASEEIQVILQVDAQR